jgi:hypothetical protein
MSASWFSQPRALARSLSLFIVDALACHRGHGPLLGLVYRARAAASAAASAAVRSLSFERLLHVAAASGAVGYSHEPLVPVVQAIGLVWASLALECPAALAKCKWVTSLQIYFARREPLAPEVELKTPPDTSGSSSSSGHFEAFDAKHLAQIEARRALAEGAVRVSCREREAQREARARDREDERARERSEERRPRLALVSFVLLCVMAADALLVRQGVFEHRGAGLSSASQLTAASIVWALVVSKSAALHSQNSQPAAPLTVGPRLQQLVDLAGAPILRDASGINSLTALFSVAADTNFEPALAAFAAAAEPAASSLTAFVRAFSYAVAPACVLPVCSPGSESLATISGLCPLLSGIPPGSDTASKMPAASPPEPPTPPVPPDPPDPPPPKRPMHADPNAYFPDVKRCLQNSLPPEDRRRRSRSQGLQRAVLVRVARRSLSQRALDSLGALSRALTRAFFVFTSRPAVCAGLAALAWYLVLGQWAFAGTTPAPRLVDASAWLAAAQDALGDGPFAPVLAALGVLLAALALVSASLAAALLVVPAAVAASVGEPLAAVVAVSALLAGLVPSGCCVALSAALLAASHARDGNLAARSFFSRRRRAPVVSAAEGPDRAASSDFIHRPPSIVVDREPRYSARAAAGHRRQARRRADAEWLRAANACEAARAHARASATPLWLDVVSLAPACARSLWAYAVRPGRARSCLDDALDQARAAEPRELDHGRGGGCSHGVRRSARSARRARSRARARLLGARRRDCRGESEGGLCAFEALRAGVESAHRAGSPSEFRRVPLVRHFPASRRALLASPEARLLPPAAKRALLSVLLASGGGCSYAVLETLALLFRLEVRFEGEGPLPRDIDLLGDEALVTVRLHVTQRRRDGVLHVELAGSEERHDFEVPAGRALRFSTTFLAGIRGGDAAGSPAARVAADLVAAAAAPPPPNGELFGHWCGCGRRGGRGGPSAAGAADAEDA